MNYETREAFLELHLNLILAGHYDYGRFLNEIRLEIETHGYSRTHQHELGIILKNLKKVDDSTLSEKLQGIIDSLGELQHS